MDRVVDERSDADLWDRTRVRDAGAFALLFDRHVDAVYRYCFRRTADWSDAEDVTSVVFMVAWRRAPQVELTTASALPWLLGVATNVMRNRRRALRRYRALLERIPPLEPERDFAEELDERLDAAERARRMLADLQHLPRREGEAVLLAASGLTSAEVAEALAVPAGTVRSRLARARRRLQARVLPDADSPPKGVNTP
jgi:RNA polymerase sigma factor (sigma-70 family)